jgi:hypothetical protein
MLILLSTDSAYSQQIKRVIGVSIDGRDTTFLMEKEFSKEGYLITDNEPYIYGFQNYKYDDKGRVKESDQVFGESMSNGGTVYDYYEYKTCSHEYAGGYTRIICDSFTTDKQLIHTYDEFIDQQEDDRNRTTTTHYFYKKKLRIKDEEIRIEYIDSTHGDTTIHITSYTHNELDSLTEILIMDLKTVDTTKRIVIKYDPNTNLKVEELHYREGNLDYQITFKYNPNKRLVEKNNIDFTSRYDNNIKIEKHNFYYKNDQLVKVIRAYEDKEGSRKEEDIYGRNVIQKTYSYLNGKKVESVNYYYTYW